MKKDLSTVFKALGHPVRLQIIQRLMKRVHRCCKINQEDQCSFEEPVCQFADLADELDLNKATLSNHLKELRYAGLIETVKDGRLVSIQVNPTMISQLRDFFSMDLDKKTEQWLESNMAGF